MTVFTSGAASAMRFTAEMPSMPGQPHVHDHDLRAEPLHGLDHVLAVLDRAHQLEVGGLSEHQAETLPHRRMVVDGQARGSSSPSVQH